MLKVIWATRQSMPQFQRPIFWKTWDLRKISRPNLRTSYKSWCPQNLLQTELLIQIKQKDPMKMSANTTRLGTVSFQFHTHIKEECKVTHISKKNVKSKIAITSALKAILKYVVMALDVKELVIVNLNLLKKSKTLRNINLLRKIVLNKQFQEKI